MEEFIRLLDAGCEELGIVLTEKQKEQFFKYFQLLTEWNQVMNLTAITEMPEVVTKHFLDSLLVVFLYRRGDRSRISRNPLKDRISTASDHASGFSEQTGGLFKHRDPGVGIDGDHGGPWKGRGLWTEQRV